MEPHHIIEELRALRNDIQEIREDLRHARGFIGGVVWIIGTMAAVFGFYRQQLKRSLLTMRTITKHIIHCSASTHGDVQEIRRWHIARGWRDIGYHFVILPNGEIEVGRMLTEIGAHCEGQNTASIGTCLVGNTSFTPVQFATLRRLHGSLREMFPGLTAHGHREFNPHKTCPNFEVSDIIK